MDGVIVVVDAVAGVQAQTRTVWNQVRKRSTPSIAFVNKMDRDGASFERCVQSLRLKLGMNAVPIQIPIGCEDAFDGVIDLLTLSKITWKNRTARNPEKPIASILNQSDKEFDAAMEARVLLIEAVAEHDDGLMEKYLESPESISTADILKALRNACVGDKVVPVLCGASLRGKGIEPLLDSVIAFLPSPVDRSPESLISKKDSKHVKLLLPTSNDLCALAFKVTHDDARGPIVFVRLFSGTIDERTVLHNSTKGVKERVNQILAVNADDLEKVQSFASGNVCCLIGLKNTTTGETLVMDKGPLQHFILAGLDLPKAVFSISIEPERSSQQTDLEKALKILTIEDPSLGFEVSNESGQTLLSGIGELHLEIVCDKIRRQFGIEVSTGCAYIAYRETLEEGTLQQGCYVYDRTYGVKRLFASLGYIITRDEGSSDVVIAVDDSVRKMLHADEYIAVLEGLQAASLRGPLGYPLVGLRVSIVTAERDQDSSPGSFRACSSALVDTVLRSSSHILLEPIMRVEIDLPTRFVGEILSDLTVKRRGLVKEVNSNNVKVERSTVHGTVPLATMLGYASSVRSMTQGEGTFSLEYSNLSVVDKDLAMKHGGSRGYG